MQHERRSNERRNNQAGQDPDKTCPYLLTIAPYPHCSISVPVCVCGGGVGGVTPRSALHTKHDICHRICGLPVATLKPPTLSRASFSNGELSHKADCWQLSNSETGRNQDQLWEEGPSTSCLSVTLSSKHSNDFVLFHFIYVCECFIYMYVCTSLTRRGYLDLLGLELWMAVGHHGGPLEEQPGFLTASHLSSPAVIS